MANNEEKELLNKQEEFTDIPQESLPNIDALYASIPSKNNTSQEDEDVDEDELEELIDQNNADSIDDYFEEMQPADFVEEVEDLDDQDIVKLSQYLDIEQLREVLEQADQDLRLRLCAILSDQQILDIFDGMSKDDIVDILGDMDFGRAKTILNHMKSGDRKIIHTLLQYPDESAGGIMTTEYIAFHHEETCGHALDVIRDIGPKTEVIETIYIVDDNRKLIGTVDLRDLLSSSRNTKLQDIMDDQVVDVEPEVDQEEVANMVSKYDLAAIPVVSHKGAILGIITVDDIIDVINAEHEEDIAHLTGTSSEEDLDSTLQESIKLRLPWLLINLLTAFMASFTVKLFESTIEQVVALSATMTIVSGMGGNAGTQTMSILIRELSKEDITIKDNWKALLKEILIGCIDGASCGLVTGFIVSLMYQNIYLGIIIFLAMIGNLVISGIFGFLVPVILKHFNVDPALASSIFVTTATDVLGFFIFLGLANLFLKMLI